MSLVRAYIALMKLRVVELLIISTIPAMILAEKGIPSLGLIVATLVGGTLAAGSANAFNMVLESDLDKLMEEWRIIIGCATNIHRSKCFTTSMRSGVGGPIESYQKSFSFIIKIGSE